MKKITYILASIFILGMIGCTKFDPLEEIENTVGVEDTFDNGNDNDISNEEDHDKDITDPDKEEDRDKEDTPRD